MVAPEPPLRAAGAPRVDALEGWVEPLAVLRTVAARRRPVLLGSTRPDPARARWSILAWDPVAELTLRGRTGRLVRHEPDPPHGARHFEGDPLDLLRAVAPSQPEAK